MPEESLITLLSFREFEVITLAAQGKTNKEIAFSLRIGEQTVKSHMSNIFKKLNADNRVHAIVILFRDGGLK